MNISRLFARFRKNDQPHWEKVYGGQSPDQLGWFQERPDLSLRFIAETALGTGARIIDVGGGASLLTGMLLEKGYQHLTVVDISARALAAARQTLGDAADRVNWLEGDITSITLDRQYDIWHDRAVFHFLTGAEERKKYLQCLAGALHPEGHFIIATFSPEAPPQCSGLPVVRYTPASLHREIGSGFELVSTREEMHQTPARTKQKFIYCHFRRRTP